MPAPAPDTVLRVRLAEIRGHSDARPPGYADDLLAAGAADPDGVHWRIPLAALLAVKAKHGVPDFDTPPDPLPETRWPLYVAAVARRRLAGERGAGDTVARVVGAFGSPEWRRWFVDNAGVWSPTCRCDLWQPRWNLLYFYQPAP